MSPKMWFRLLGLSCLLIVVGFVVPALTQNTKKGKKHALLVGVTKYDSDAFRHLRYTENDVEKLAEILTGKGGGFDTVRVLSQNAGKKNAKNAPTAENVKSALEELLEGKKRNDTVLIAFSGHGATVQVEDPEEDDKKRGKPKTFPFFCPSDADLVKISYSTGRSKTLVNLDEMFEALRACGAGSKLVLIDACRNELKAKSATRKLDVGAVSVPKGVAALFSCSEDEAAWESETLKHGVFFHFVLEGLRGRAKNSKGEVTWARLSEYVTTQVPEQVGKIVGDGAKQTPHEVRNVRGTSPVLVRVEDGFTNSIGMKFVRIPKGKFMMGSPKDEASRIDDETEHEVEITKDYYLGVFEVTQGQFREVVGFNPSHFSHDGKKGSGGQYPLPPAGGKDAVKRFTQKQLDDFPVENVSWEEAQEFVKKLNAKVAEKTQRRVYRLPTEAEWEYACRGGSAFTRKPFSFKQPSDSLGAGQANFESKHPYGDGKSGDPLERSHAVGKNGEPNALGLYDMHGNVWEWCNDWRDWYDVQAHALKDPSGPTSGSARVIRGGSWYDWGQMCRAARRSGFSPSTRGNNIGFRVALVPAR